MATLPVANYLTDSARTEGEVKTSLEAWLASTKQIPGSGQVELSVTISGGSITPAGGSGVLAVETESLAATDDLTNIITTNYPDGACLLLRNTNNARFVVVKNAATGSGQIHLDRDVDYVLDDTEKWILLQRRGADWYEIVRGPSRLSMPVVAKNATFTVQREDLGKVFLCTNNIVVNFAAAAVLGNGFCCSIINGNTASIGITLDPNGTETIDRGTSLVMQPTQASLIVCNGTSFYSVDGFKKPDRVAATFAATLNINYLDGNYFEVSALTGNVTTLSINNVGFFGERLRIRFVQDGTGSRTVALPTGPNTTKVSGSLAATANQASVLDITASFSGSRWEGFWTQIPL